MKDTYLPNIMNLIWHFFVMDIMRKLTQSGFDEMDQFKDDL